MNNNQAGKSNLLTIDHVLWLIWLIPIGIVFSTVMSLSPSIMLDDWLERELNTVLIWWLMATVAGIGAMPLLSRVLTALPDRGYTVARPAGLMFTGFIYWLTTSLQLTRNEVGTIVLAWALMVIFGIVVWIKGNDRPAWSDIKTWLLDHYALIIVAEVLFLLALIGWAFIRAHNPEIGSTEKPMEVMFVNGIRNSEVFPPKDPWYAGYSISYYYFGYVIMAGMADLSNTATSVAFTLTNALTFALTAVGILGLVYNLIRARGTFQHWQAGSRTAAIGAGLLGVVFLLIMGHLSTYVVELPNRGYDTVVSDVVTIDEEYFEYWDMQNRDGTADADFDEIPNWADDKQEFSDKKWDYWWWFSHSRVVQDRDFNGNLYGEPIVEFPQFSFVLGDNHPHVLALPYALLALSLIAGLAMRPRNLALWEIAVYAIFIGGMVFMNAWDAIYIILAIGAEALRRLIRNGTGQLTGLTELVDLLFPTGQAARSRIILALVVLVVLFLAIVIFPISMFSGMPFLLRFVFAVLLTPFVTIFALWGLGHHDWGGVIRFGAILGILSWIFYAPWYLSFTSQANGIYPNIIYPTRYQQFILQFGIFAFIIAAFVILDFVRNSARFNWALAIGVVIVGFLLSFGIGLGSTYVLDSQCSLVAGQEGQIFQLTDERERSACEARQQLFAGLAREDENLFSNVLERRLDAAPNEFFLLLVIGYVAGRLFPTEKIKRATENPTPYYHPGLSMSLLIMAAGAVIILAPDLIYVRDVFNVRMNTIFKMYYQGWLLWSVASAYAVYYLLSHAPKITLAAPQWPNVPMFMRQAGLGASVLLLVYLGMHYPYYAIQSRYIDEAGRRDVVAEEQRPLSLNGVDSAAGRELAAIECLQELEPYGSDAIVLEAPFNGGYWSAGRFGRFSMLTGLPTLLGWRNHESQWRGDSFEAMQPGQRFSDAERIYTTENWPEAQGLIEKYGIDYVVVGDLEFQEYNELLEQRGLDKFAEIFEPVCTAANGAIAVYDVSAE